MNKTIIAFLFPAAIVASYLAGKVDTKVAVAQQVSIPPSVMSAPVQTCLTAAASSLMPEGKSVSLQCSQVEASLDGVKGVYWACSSEGVALKEASELAPGEAATIVPLPK